MGKKLGFTLAEILITIGIIGVIAAMTIPSLLHDMRNKELESGFKKAYSTLSQLIMNLNVEEGSVWANYNYNDNFGRPGYTYTSSFSDAVKSKLILAKDCGVNGCVPNATYYRNFTNTADFMNTTNFKQGQFYLPGGMLIMPMVYATFIAIYVDTNGYLKPPNRAGYDLFMFQLLNTDRLAPGGSKGTIYSYNIYCTSDSITFNGIGCGVKAFTDENYFKNLP